MLSGIHTRARSRAHASFTSQPARRVVKDGPSSFLNNRTSVSTRPSPTLRITLPVKPSQTITSAFPLKKSRASRLPTNCSGDAASSACASRTTSLPFPPLHLPTTGRHGLRHAEHHLRVRNPSRQKQAGGEGGNRGWRRCRAIPLTPSAWAPAPRAQDAQRPAERRTRHARPAGWRPCDPRCRGRLRRHAPRSRPRR